MRTRFSFAALLCLFLIACSQSGKQGEGAPRVDDQPRRIVSLDYCADQYVLEFAPRESILALSIDADKPFSYLRDEAKALRQVRPRAADILALEPDLVVRSYGGGPNISAFMERAGVPVLQMAFPQTIEEVKAEVTRIGSALGNPSHAGTVVDDLERRLAAIAKRSEGHPKTLYLTPGGVTAGEGTMIHELLLAAGLENFQEDAGWHPIPLERLAYERPELVVGAFFESEAGDLKNWSAARHPIARKQLEERPVASVDGAWTACGGWFLIEAVETMAKMAEAAKTEGAAR